MSIFTTDCNWDLGCLEGCPSFIWSLLLLFWVPEGSLKKAIYHVYLWMTLIIGIVIVFHGLIAYLMPI